MVSGSGSVVWADSPGVPPGCFAFAVEDGDGLHVMVCHLILDRLDRRAADLLR